MRSTRVHWPSGPGRTSARLLGVLAATVATVAAVAVTLLAVGASPAAAAKPVPVPATGSGGVTVPKPAHAGTVVRPLVPFTVTLAVSPGTQWPTLNTTLSATANQDVGPTPYWISIFDTSTGSPGARVALCGSGTTCVATVTSPVPASRIYTAYVSLSTAPPTGIQAQSASQWADWRGVTLSLTANPSTMPLGSPTTLTVTDGGVDVGPSPFFLNIWDADTHILVISCGFGTSCSWNVTTNGSHEYVATLATDSVVYPGANVQAYSNPVFTTWTATTWRISLSFTYANGGASATITALANQNVQPTIYWIEIFDAQSRTRVQFCGAGTGCSVTVALHAGSNQFVAFVSANDAHLRPATTQATSNSVFPYYYVIG